MRARTAALLVPALLLGAGGLTAADAATKPVAKPKPVCNLIPDAEGDQALVAVKTTDGDDLVGADFASDGTTVTAVIKAKTLATSDPTAPLGRSYYVDFNLDKSDVGLFLSARVYPTGTTYTFGYRGVDPDSGLNTAYSLGEAKGKLDTATGTITMTAQAKDFDKAQVKLVKGAKVTPLTASIWRISGQGVVPSQEVSGHRVPLGGLQSQVDTADGQPYVIGTPSCVTPVS